MRYELSDKEWSIIRTMLPTKPRGVPRVDDRRVLNGIFWVLRSGAPWRDLPASRSSHHCTIFVRWRRAGVWDRIMQALTVATMACNDRSQWSASSSARPDDSGNQAVGRSRGGLTSKLHVVVDRNGLPLRLGITAGQAHDNRLCSTLLSGLAPRTMLLADRGYDAGWIRTLVNEQGAWANIPPKRNRREPICFSPHLYRARNCIERFFNKIKHCRRFATRYDKLAANYLAFVQLASIRLWLRVYEFTT